MNSGDRNWVESMYGLRMPATAGTRALEVDRWIRALETRTVQRGSPGDVLGTVAARPRGDDDAGQR